MTESATVQFGKGKVEAKNFVIFDRMQFSRKCDILYKKHSCFMCAFCISAADGSRPERTANMVNRSCRDGFDRKEEIP